VIIVALRPRAEERGAVRLLFAIIALHIIGVALQGKFFIYHWGATWPLTAMLAALGWWRVWRVSAARGPLGAVACGILVALLASRKSAFEPFSFVDRSEARLRLLVDGNHEGWDQLATIADVNAAANRAVAAIVRERTRPSEPIFVWGFEPVIYDLAEREPSSRFIYNVPLRVSWSARQARSILMRELHAKPPSAIVVEHRDVFPFVTGDSLDSAQSLLQFPELRDLIVGGYTRIAIVQDFEVYIAR
jgi:hypothetical protein